MSDTQNLQGLSPAQVEESRRLHGVNILTPPPKPSIWKKFLTYLNDPLIKILILALALSIGISVYEYMDGTPLMSVIFEPLGIFIAILLATVIGFAIEVNAEKKFEILNKVNDDLLVKVIREGRVTQVPRRDIVVGDLVIIETGDEIPADGRIINSIGLSVNESTLTGEPQVRKSHNEADLDSEATYPTNMAMRGTVVVEGHATMLVTAVGDNTEYGKVYEASQIESNIKTPLTIQFDRLGKLISVAAICIGVLVMIGRLALHDWAGSSTEADITYVLHTVMIAVTLIVVSVPEGLPMSVTLSLALSMRRMLICNNLVRKMHACETMGATTVICTDKTGTLTQNQMRVYTTRFFALGTDQKLTDNKASGIVEEGIAVNSTSFLEYPADGMGRVQALGNPTEGALLLWLYDNGVDYLKLREQAAVVEQLSFSTQRKYMATVVDSPILGAKVLYIKGAPEIVLGMCKKVENDVDRTDIADTLLQYQSQAMRTLGFAYAVLPEGAQSPIVDGKVVCNDLTFIGICAISDPVRKEVPDAIKGCINAGISVKIVTGDTPGTAREIGRQVGLWNDGDTDECHISGPDFAALSDEEARKRVAALKIMSRARPTDKSRLVRLLQEAGEVVAVTGDGTNDAPALKAAQVGLSMGDGTSVAKQASDITIMDNSFASITKAVMWGRSLYQNIQRFILFQLTVNIAACMIVLLGAFTGSESPLTVTQILWVNLIMDSFAALALASLPPSDEVLKNKPRKSSDFIINGKMARTIVGCGLLFTVLLYGLMQYLRCYPIETLLDFNFIDYLRSFTRLGNGELTPYDLTLFFNFFVLIQMWNLFNAKDFGSKQGLFHDMSDSKIFVGVFAAIFGGQMLIVYFGGQMFNVVPLRPVDMAITLGVTSLIMLVPQTLKLISHPQRKR